jgi:hypothetical protein|nr:MAG TPA: protein of unknown function (DUF4747) [Caudoviricetes sp.]
MSVIYFSKINLNSEHIFDVYQKKIEMKKILNAVMKSISEPMEYNESYSYIDNGEIYDKTIKFEFKVLSKTDESIVGYIYRTSNISYNLKNDETDELQRMTTPNTDAIKFYFDVYKEIIGFTTRQRFKTVDFNKAIEYFINEALKINQYDYRFTVSLYNEGLDISDIKSELKKIPKIKELVVKYQPPNPDSKELDEIWDNGDGTLDEMKTANVTNKSVIFKSKGTTGLNIEAKIIDDELNAVSDIYKCASFKSSISKGYISVDAIARNGKKYTTSETKPVKTNLDDENMFIEVCKEIISSL